jgi:replicative superfamily II helicase
MTIVTRKYVRKPLIVDAVQVTVENFEELADWCQGSIVNNDKSEPVEEVDPSIQHIHVRVHNPRSERQTKAFVGDWILYTERGYKIYNTKAFTGTFAPYDTTG